MSAQFPMAWSTPLPALVDVRQTPRVLAEYPDDVWVPCAGGDGWVVAIEALLAPAEDV